MRGGGAAPRLEFPLQTTAETKARRTQHYQRTEHAIYLTLGGLSRSHFEILPFCCEFPVNACESIVGRITRVFDRQSKQFENAANESGRDRQDRGHDAAPLSSGHVFRLIATDANAK